MKQGSNEPYYMPVWSEVELGNISNILDPYWAENFYLCGGVARTLQKDKDQIQLSINKAISQKGDNTTSIFKLTHSDLPDKSVSHVLAFPIPIDHSFQKINHRISSSYVIELLSDKFNKNILDEQLNLIETGAYMNLTKSGDLFENLFLRKIKPLPGKSYLFKSFTDNNGIIYFTFSSESKSFSKADIDNNIEFKENILYCPLSKTQEGFDAFYIKNDPNDSNQFGIYFFQVTIADTHSVKFNGLKKILDRVKSDLKRFLVFVIPSDSEMNLKKDQLITTEKGTVYKLHTNIEQYYLKINIKKDLFN